MKIYFFIFIFKIKILMALCSILENLSYYLEILQLLQNHSYFSEIICNAAPISDHE